MRITAKFILLISTIFYFGSCSEQVVSDNWTENQEIHFYNDCREKMILNGNDSAMVHAFCECCLLKLKDSYSDGREAMNNLTDIEIQEIEKSCFDKQQK